MRSQDDIVLVGPQIKVSGHKLGALIDPDSLGVAKGTGLVEPAHHVFATVTEAWIDDWREPPERVDHCEHPDLHAGRKLVVHNVHCPGFVWLRRLLSIVPQLRLDPPLRRLVAVLQARLTLDSVCLLDADIPARTLKHNMHTAMAILHTDCADLLGASFKTGLIGATGFVVICGSTNFQDTARPTNRNILFLTNRIDQLALPR
jgi:hypothetical protein